MKVINRAKAPLGGVISRPVFAVKSNNVRQILSLNGDTQFLKFAKPILGAGQGEIRIVCKVKDLAGLPFYLFDGTGDVSRMYTYRSHDQDRFVGPNIATLVNLISDTPIYGELCEIVITGQFTDLEISRFFARYSDTEFAKAQVFSISYKDDNHNFAYDFTKVVSSYWLPEGAERGRNLVESYEVGVIATGSQFVNLAPAVGTVSTGWFEVTPDTVLLVTRQNSTRSRWQYSTNNLVSAVYGGDETGQALTVPTGATHMRVYFGNSSDISPSIEIREVVNALILQSPSAIIDDDFEPMVQRGDGHWVGKKNLWAGGAYQLTGAEAENAIPVMEDTLEVGESYLSKLIKKGDNPGSTTRGLTGNQTVYTDLIEVVAGSNLNRFQLRGTPPYSGSISMETYHLIKLSDHLQKQFIIEQTKAKAAGYQAKNKQRNITSLDGVDDQVVLPERLGYIGDFYFDFKGSFPTGGFYLLAEHDGYSYRVCITAIHTLYINNTQISTLNDTSFMGDNTHHSLVLMRIAGKLVLVLDYDFDNPLIQIANNTSEIKFNLLYGQWGGATSIPNASGTALSVLAIDLTNPLPIGQGGNSGYWPLDDPKGTIAANKLGLDKKGNVVVKEGAGSETVYNETVVFEGAEPAYRTKGSVADALTAGVVYEFTVDASEITGGHVKAVVLGNPDANGKWMPKVLAGSSETFLWAASQNSHIGIQNEETGVAGTAKVTAVALHDYGEWQGLSATFEETQPVTRDEDGAYVGDNLIPSTDYSDGFWAGSFSSGGEGFFVTAAGGLGPRTVFDTTLSAGRMFRVIADGLSDGVTINTRSNESGVQSILQSDGETVVAIPAGETGVQLYIRSGNSGTHTAKVQIVEYFPLSAELQRQWDLAIVEKQLGKQLKKVAKTEAFAHLDAIDDHTAIPAKSFDGSFEIERSFCVANTSDEQWLYSDWIDNVSERSVGIRIRNGKLETYISHDGIGTTVGPTVDVEADIRHTFKFKFNSGVSMELSLDNANPVVVLTDKDATFTTNNEINLGRKSTGIEYLDGKDGYLLLKDIANPKSSRFYVHNSDGYFEDRLAPVGSELAKDCLSLANWDEVAVTKALVDGEIKLTALDGAYDRGQFAVEGLNVGDYYQVDVSARPGVGVQQYLEQWTFAVIPLTRVDEDKVYSFIVKATSTEGVIRAYASRIAGAVGDEIFVKGISVKHLPNLGIHVGFSADYSEIKTFKKKGDDWRSENLFDPVTNSPAGWNFGEDTYTSVNAWQGYLYPQFPYQVRPASEEWELTFTCSGQVNVDSHSSLAAGTHTLNLLEGEYGRISTGVVGNVISNVSFTKIIKGA